jgi:hypothetical protein
LGFGISRTEWKTFDASALRFRRRNVLKFEQCKAI